MKKYLFLINLAVCLLLFNGCEKSTKNTMDNMLYRVDNIQLDCPVESVTGPTNSVIGKWKLVKVVLLMAGSKVGDYSCSTEGHEDIYHFRTDGKVLMGPKSPFGDPGISPYELHLSPLNESVEEKYTLKIGDFEYGCSIEERGKVLKISSGHTEKIDRNIKYFVRIE